MSRLKRTVVWVENNYGEEIKLTPLVYSKDSEGNQVLIAKIEETRYIASHIVPLLIPENFKGETRDVQVLARKQNIGKFKADELSFNDTTDFTDYFFFVYLLPSVSQKACRKIRRTCQQVCQKLPQARQKINGLFKFFRDSLNKIRSLNPQFYDKIVRYLWIIWEAIIALLSLFAVITSGWAAYSIIGFYALLIAFQVGSERNNAERMVAEKEKDCAARIKKYEEEKEKVKEQSKIEISRSLLDLSILEHHAAHGGKLCVFDMITGSSDEDRSIKLVQYLKKCADDLERQLSDYYHKDISASFKLAVSETTLRTCTRGKNNLSSRKIIGEPPPEKIRTIQKNTAYKHIFIDQHSCFNSGDLLKYNNEHSNNSKFKCERRKWRDFFLSTIVIPIRWHVPDDESYRVVGVICVDCKTAIEDWDSTDSFGYHMVAFYADLLFMSVKEFDNRRNATTMNT